MNFREYQYVGPDDIREATKSAPPGSAIRSQTDLLVWLKQGLTERRPDGFLVATFVVNCEGSLLLAPRRSEHVACASGEPVLSAGEVAFADDGEVFEISNQSTGYCPPPESWLAVASALTPLAIEYPPNFTLKITFRRCTECGQRNIVKDEHFVCAVCEGDLAADWNFD